MKALSQQDIRWAAIRLGTSRTTTIGSHGCVITCLAMLLGETPDTVNKKLIEGKGYANVNLVDWSALPRIFPQIKSYKRYYKYNDSDVKENLPCLVEVDGAPIGSKKHWVLYIGNKRLIDPWTGKERLVGFYRAIGYCAIKIDNSSIMNNTDSPSEPTMDKAAIDYLFSKGIKTEGDARGLIGQVTDFLSLQTDHANLITKYDQKTKEMQIDIDKSNSVAQSREKELKDFTSELALTLGSPQDRAKILAEVKGLVVIEDQLKTCQKSLQDALSGVPIKGHNSLDSLIVLTTKIINYLVKWLKKSQSVKSTKKGSK